MKKIKRFLNKQKWLLVGLSVLVLSGIGLYYTTLMRSNVGYWIDGALIFWNNFFYVVFFAIITGLVVGGLLQKIRFKKS